MTLAELDGIVWRKSSYSANGGSCVEVGWPDTSVAVRDSKSTSPTLAFPQPSWRALLASLAR